MAKISILIALLPHLLSAMVQGQPSLCSKYFTYITKPGITNILAQIEVPPPSANDTFYLRVALNTATELPVVRLELAQTIQESVLAVYFKRPLLYHVYFPIHQSPPTLSAIWFNSQRYCLGPQVSDNITATVELGHILYPPNEETLINNNGPWQEVSQPWHRNSSIYRIDNPSYDRLNKESEFDTQCGIPSNVTDNRINVDGDLTVPGQWPWLVAIYIQRTDNESVYDFKCVGSLLTTRHVITEKFCILTWKEDFNNGTLVELESLHVSFGQLNSREWHGNHTGIVNRVIVDYKVYDVSGNHGLVILILKTAVEYNTFIRPVCIWSGSTHLRDIVSMKGYVVGWGHNMTWFKYDKDSWKTNTGEPRVATVTLNEVSERAAKGTHKELLFARNSLYNNPCDPGSGLVIFNIHTGRYELRGVAYSCHPVECNLEFLDVANQISWIRQQISNT